MHKTARADGADANAARLLQRDLPPPPVGQIARFVEFLGARFSASRKSPGTTPVTPSSIAGRRTDHAAILCAIEAGDAVSARAPRHRATCSAR